MNIEKDKFVEIARKENIGTFIYVPSNYPGPIAINATINQPERTSEKDRKVCDVPNTPTKGSESSRND